MNNKRKPVKQGTAPMPPQRSGKGTIAGQELTSTDKAFLLACEMGNINELKKLMQASPPPDLNAEDSNGRTAYVIALDRDDVDLVEYLVPFGDEIAIANLLLEAISEKKETIACTILKNMQDEEKGVNLMRQLQAKKLMGDNTGVDNMDVTPMMAASQRNLYEVVRSLYDRGETIEKPHPYRCICEECVLQSTVDQLRFAQLRLHAYKAITSESYLSIVSEDPINDAFHLSGEMKEIAVVEKHFKAEYLALSEQLSVYLYRLMDRVRDQAELECILNRADSDDPTVEVEEPIARIKMAIEYEEKKFVAHPSCQMKLVNLWYRGAEFLEKGSKLNRLVYFFVVVTVHPFLVPVYVFAPNHRFVAFLKAPVIKFSASTVCFIAFLAIIISWSFNTGRVLPIALDLEGYPNVKPLFKEDSHNQGHYVLRQNKISMEEYMILVWVLGYLWSQIHQVYDVGIAQHFKSLYRHLDFACIALYFSSLSLRYSIFLKVNTAITFYEDPDKFALLEDGNETAISHYYWMNADRFYWDSRDPHHIAEGIFAIANVLTFFRVSNLLPVNELLGPLQISLGRMMYDISRFTVIFLMVFIAFLIGLDNLFWYYDDANKKIVELVEHPSTKAGDSFGSFTTALGSVFWGLFGMTSQSSVNVEPYDATFTQDVASVLYGAYEVSVVIVLLNMLIAMMSSSFEQIEQESDIEWKFARSKLYLEFIEEGNVLPAPLNLLEIIMKPMDILVYVIRRICNSCKSNGQKKHTVLKRGSFTETWKAEERTRRIAAFKDLDQEMTVVYNDALDLKPPVSTTVEMLPVKYKEVVSRVVERFIFDNTAGDEAQDEDDMADMRQDMTRMRRDVINSMSVQEHELQGMRNDLVDLTAVLDTSVDNTERQAVALRASMSVQEQNLEDMRNNLAELADVLGTSVKNSERQVTECRDNVAKLETAVQSLYRVQEESLHMYLAITERVYHSLNVLSNQALGIQVAPDSSLTHILSFQADHPPSSSQTPKPLNFIDQP